MRQPKKRAGTQWIVYIIVILWGMQTAVFAQEPPTTPLPWLAITGSDASSPPGIELQAVGMDGQGNALDFNSGGIILEQNGALTAYEVVGPAQIGTLTIFLLDIPAGVAEQLPAIERAIKAYASPANMVEGVDYVAIYKIGDTGPEEILAPTSFYNAVQNAFATPLQPETDITALLDSTMDMLDQMEGLKPNPAMVASLVVMSDGTDALSSRFTTTDIAPHAANLGFPVHSAWLNNANLPGLSIGREYLGQVAAGSRGVAVSLENEADLPQIWNRISSFRDQARLRFDMADPAGGQINVVMSLVNNPEVKAEEAIAVSGSLPSVIIDLPIESRLMSLPNLDKPVKLSFATTVSWLDGVERRIEAAQLVVNGAVVQDIPVNTLKGFTAEINNLVYGDNIVQVAVLDEQGFPVTSPPVNLTVQEGSRDVPAELGAGGLSGFLGTLVWLLFLAALLLAVMYVARRYKLLSHLKLPRRSGRQGRTAVASYDDPASYSSAGDSPVVTAVVPLAYLEVLESVTRLPDRLELKASQVSLGRSPAQSDIAFENDITVSRLHASLHLDGAHYRIYDERSTSGVWVNEQQVPEYGVQLMDGDEIHLGAVHLRYREM